MATENGTPVPGAQEDEPPTIDLLDLLIALANHRKRLLFVPILVGLLAYAAATFLPPRFTARASFLPPQQQQSASAGALASLGALAGLAGGAAKSPAEQYVTLMQSDSVTNAMLDRFDLIQVYGKAYRVDARSELGKRSRFAVGRKDGLITVEVDDASPQRAAEIANGYVDELRRMTSQLAVTEAQQRRVFFEGLLTQTRGRLTEAQAALQASGFSLGALRSEPRAAAESYARLRAEVTAAEVRLQSLRSYLSDSAPELQRALSTLGALRSQLSRLEQSEAQAGGPDYVGKFRAYKYEETLFELYARQFELARVDESREGALIQVVDAATPPEKASKPRKLVLAATLGLGTFLVLALWAIVAAVIRAHAADPRAASKISLLGQVLRGKPSR